MNIDEIREIISALENTDIKEFEYEKAGMKVRIKKGAEPVISLREGAAVKIPPGAVEEKPGPSEVGPEEKSHANRMLIKSPIVGTFYRSHSPDGEPYVEIGSLVKKGQIVCIIEAMKLMNEIESDVDGKIVEVLSENAHPVEYGEPLFSIEPV